MSQYSEQQVRERAYFIWEDEGRVFGRAEVHWFQAEAEFATAAAEAVLTVEPVVEASAPAPAKALKAATTRKAKAEKAPAKAANTVEAPKAASKARRAPRGGESTAALH